MNLKLKLPSYKQNIRKEANVSLIKVLTNQNIKNGMLPADVGCIVSNVASIIAIYDAVALNIPLIEKIVTVTGDVISKPQNFRVRLGTKYQILVDACDGFKIHPQKIISGGPMMGTALFNLGNSGF